YAGGGKYQLSKGADRYRRGLYTFFRRTAIDPNLATFDCPDSSMSRAKRDRSNNPLQALAMLENEVFHEAAQAFAVRLLNDVPGAPSEATDRERLERGFQIAVSRSMALEEYRQLAELLAEARQYYREHPKEAEALCGKRTAKNTEPSEQAAWVATVRVLLNLDEFVTRP
ncbi:MAG TPA: DUF1553 domain-containing protein, partial [Planctomycetaceae bacterium]|nr:DUF1553 domain-containing protein [Planctomycetaceae bacterium]